MKNMDTSPGTVLALELEWCVWDHGHHDGTELASGGDDEPTR
jgi:hypothetical protein